MWNICMGSNQCVTYSQFAFGVKLLKMNENKRKLFIVNKISLLSSCVHIHRIKKVICTNICI